MDLMVELICKTPAVKLDKVLGRGGWSFCDSISKPEDVAYGMKKINRAIRYSIEPGPPPPRFLNRAERRFRRRLIAGRRRREALRRAHRAFGSLGVSFKQAAAAISQFNMGCNRLRAIAEVEAKKRAASGPTVK